MNRALGICGAISKSHVCVIGVSERKEKATRAEKLFEEIVSETFKNMLKEMNWQI